MIAQLSQSEPFGRPSSSSIGVRCAGSLARNSGVVVAPQTSRSSKSSPAARTKIRAVRLLTLGLRMLSVCAAISSSRGAGGRGVGVLRLAVVGQRLARAADEALDRVREVGAVDVVVAAIDADAVRLEQHLGVRVRVRRLEAVGGELDQQAERVLEVDRVHEAAVLDAAVADAALVEALDGLEERRLAQAERDVVHRSGV